MGAPRQSSKHSWLAWPLPCIKGTILGLWLVCGQSDHSPILILPEGILAKPQWPWRFEQFWLERDGCQDIVAHSWDTAHSGSPMALAVGKIDRCQANMKKWSKNSVCNISRSLMEKKKDVGKSRGCGYSRGQRRFFSAIKIWSKWSSPNGRANVATEKSYPLADFVW